jgi:hypothetical protein
MGTHAGIESTHAKKYGISAILDGRFGTIPLPRRGKNLWFS